MLNAIALADDKLDAPTTDLRTFPGKAAHVRYTVYRSCTIVLLFICYLFIVKYNQFMPHKKILSDYFQKVVNNL